MTRIRCCNKPAGMIELDMPVSPLVDDATIRAMQIECVLGRNWGSAETRRCQKR